MIHSSHRFHGRAGVRRVYRLGDVVRASGANLKYTISNKPGYKAAVVVSKKVHKSAVVRNRIRRRVYEIVRTRVDVETAYHMVITIYDVGFAEEPAERIEAIISELLQRAGVPLRPVAVV